MRKLPSFDHIQDPEARTLLELMAAMIESLQATVELQSHKIDELARLMRDSKSERKTRSSRRKPKRELTEEERKKKKEAEQRRRKENKAKKKDLPTEEIHHQVPSEEQVCEHCDDGTFQTLGEGEVSYEYEFIPAKLIQRKHIREKKLCSCGKTLLTAPSPERVAEWSHHGPELHAHVVVSKCHDSIPFHRLSRQFAISKLHLSKSTICDMFHRAAEQLRPLHKRLMELIRSSSRVNGDETRLQVLSKNKTRRAWMWTFLTEKMVGFQFSFSRSGQTPVAFLGGTTGKLQVDAYTEYNKVCVPEGRERVGCWAHVRRKFFDAESTAPEESNQVLEMIRELYEVEYLAVEEHAYRTERHAAMRKLLSQDILDKMKTWMTKRQAKTPPKSPLGKALNYALNQWETLIQFVEDVHLPLDNNIAERALRTIAIGRKNFLFVGNNQAGQNLAILQSLVSTCVANKVNPREYLADVLVRIQTHPMKRIDELLPMLWKKPTP